MLVLIVDLSVATADTESVPVSVLWAGAIAVIVASLITAVGVAFQTRRTLKATEKQLDRQLSHDRAMKEREELRRLVDEAVARLDLLVDEALEARKRESSTPQARDSSQEERLQAVFRGLREVDTLAGRLAVRLGQDHFAVETYREAWVCFQEIYEALLADEVSSEKFTQAGEHAGEFMRQSHRLVGSELEAS